MHESIYLIYIQHFSSVSNEKEFEEFEQYGKFWTYIQDFITNEGTSPSDTNHSGSYFAHK